MSKEKEFDVESISGYQYMEEADKEYFEKFGSAVDAQLELITEQNEIDPITMSAQYDFLLDTLVSNSNEYIVNGAPLGCSNWIEEPQELTYQNGTIKSTPIGTYNMSMLKLAEDRKENANGFVFANVLDTQGGLRDEVLERVKEAIEQGKGTCYCCMHLNSEWENMPTGYDFGTNSFQPQSPTAGIISFLNNESYMRFDGAEGINMMSMVFCRRGGIISAKESGQSSVSLSITDALWRDLKDMGYDDVAVAAIMGNISWESGGYDVGKTQDGGDPYQKGVGIGLCQWTYQPRKDALFSVAAELGKTWDTYDVQISYLKYELLEGNDFETVRPENMNGNTDVNATTEYFMWEFEKPDKNRAHLEERQAEAERILKEYCGK